MLPLFFFFFAGLTGAKSSLLDGRRNVFYEMCFIKKEA